jgi:ABC-type multidrug transport system fused ATPase/permease subunit
MNQKEVQKAITNGIFYGGLKLMLVSFVASLFLPYIYPFAAALAMEIAISFANKLATDAFWYSMIPMGVMLTLVVAFRIYYDFKNKKSKSDESIL